MSSPSALLYEQVVDVTSEYLGPAADRFISRQIRNHLEKSPEELTRRDLLKLIDWIKLTMAFLTSDESVVDQYIAELSELASSGRKSVGARAKHAAS